MGERGRSPRAHTGPRGSNRAPESKKPSGSGFEKDPHNGEPEGGWGVVGRFVSRGRVKKALTDATRRKPRKPGGRVQKPGGRVQKPGGRVKKPGGRVKKPGGRVKKPGGRVKKPGGRVKNPAGG